MELLGQEAHVPGAGCAPEENRPHRVQVLRPPRDAQRVEPHPERRRDPRISRHLGEFRPDRGQEIAFVARESARSRPHPELPPHRLVRRLDARIFGLERAEEREQEERGVQRGVGFDPRTAPREAAGKARKLGSVIVAEHGANEILRGASPNARAVPFAHRDRELGRAPEPRFHRDRDGQVLAPALFPEVERCDGQPRRGVDRAAERLGGRRHARPVERLQELDIAVAIEVPGQRPEQNRRAVQRLGARVVAPRRARERGKGAGRGASRVEDRGERPGFEHRPRSEREEPPREAVVTRASHRVGGDRPVAEPRMSVLTPRGGVGRALQARQDRAARRLVEPQDSEA